MKRGVLAIVAGVLVCAAGTWAGPLQNGSFEEEETEQDNAYGDLAANWGRWGNWMNRETSWKPVKKGKCLIGYHHWRIEEESSSGIYQDVEDTPAGAEITFTICASKDSDTNAESVELRLEKLNGEDVVASQIYPMAAVKSGGWGKLSVTGTNPDEGVRVVVVVTPAQAEERTGAVKFDDASLKVSGEKGDGVAARRSGRGSAG